MNSSDRASAARPPRAYCLLGAIAGDVIGSVYEFEGCKDYDFELFTESSRVTDDSILTLAIADAILSGRSYAECVREYALAHPRAGYGGFFRASMRSSDPQPYGSYGNGSAMRVSAVAWAFLRSDQVLEEAKRSAEITHNHPEGIKGAQAIALAIFLARTGSSKDTIKQEITSRFGYDLTPTLSEIWPAYSFDETCQGTVPPALIAFLESGHFEDAIRKAVSLGGDADTLGAITGSVAEAYYGVPRSIAAELHARVLPELWAVVERFSARFASTPQ